MFKKWRSYFENNQDHLSDLDVSDNNGLKKEELKTIFNSIQQFQKGENSEGKNLYNFAKSWGNQDYFETIKLFIKEEQNHALALGTFMKANEIPKIKHHWVDVVFRGLRKIGGLENSINVLLTAEVIAAIYYRALREATENRMLRKICDQILLDEEMHINFQSRTLGFFYMGKSVFSRSRSVAFKRILMVGTLLVVWVYHGKVYRKGGYSLAKYVKETWREYLRSEYMQRGKSPIMIRERSLVYLS
ncbi:MAG: ferritin-like domain-containing protein [Flavobacteriales bacterium]|nr:ferritin-like domain-containing protein [Flavobacteriales bacterium]